MRNLKGTVDLIDKDFLGIRLFKAMFGISKDTLCPFLFLMLCSLSSLKFIDT